jgi:hypothetical protein
MPRLPLEAVGVGRQTAAVVVVVVGEVAERAMVVDVLARVVVVEVLARVVVEVLARVVVEELAARVVVEEPPARVVDKVVALVVDVDELRARVDVVLVTARVVLVGTAMVVLDLVVVEVLAMVVVEVRVVGGVTNPTLSGSMVVARADVVVDRVVMRVLMTGSITMVVSLMTVVGMGTLREVMVVGLRVVVVGLRVVVVVRLLVVVVVRLRVVVVRLREVVVVLLRVVVVGLRVVAGLLSVVVDRLDVTTAASLRVTLVVVEVDVHDVLEVVDVVESLVVVGTAEVTAASAKAARMEVYFISNQSRCEDKNERNSSQCTASAVLQQRNKIERTNGIEKRMDVGGNRSHWRRVAASYPYLSTVNRQFSF